MFVVLMWQAGVYSGKMAADPDMLPGYDHSGP